jgi:uridylate kinase
MMIKATKVDGIYDSDPMKNPDAKKYDTISYKEVLSKQLKILDATAVSIAEENSLPIKVVNINKPEDIIGAINGEHVGSSIEMNPL